MLWTELGRIGRGVDPWYDFDWETNLVDRAAAVPAMQAVEFPLVNVWVNEDEAVLTTEIPGIDAKSVEISIVGKTVSLRGSREPESEAEEKIYHRRERWYGQFSRTIELPFNIESTGVEALFSKGVLQVTLPKAQADKPRKIKVKSE
jgi:HSP20 family protein